MLEPISFFSRAIGSRQSRRRITITSESRSQNPLRLLRTGEGVSYRRLSVRVSAWMLLEHEAIEVSAGVRNGDLVLSVHDGRGGADVSPWSRH